MKKAPIHISETRFQTIASNVGCLQMDMESNVLYIKATDTYNLQANEECDWKPHVSFLQKIAYQNSSPEL